MIYRIILFCTSFILALNLSAQYTLNYDAYIDPVSIDSLQSKVEVLQEILKKERIGQDTSILKVNVIKDIKELSDYLYYKSIWDSYKVDTSKENRIVLLRQLMQYKYSTVSNYKLNKNARTLYQESRKALIYEYRGNVELLESVEVNPAYQAIIYPFLKREIIAAGGIWKRGEILNLSNHELIKINNEK
ncbi:MAG: hypothetical protein GY705_10760 [Bacteroidetes bacterium]|nr:hypothetical protein [Bacteroidota bacterium]